MMKAWHMGWGEREKLGCKPFFLLFSQPRRKWQFLRYKGFEERKGEATTEKEQIVVL